MKKWSNIRKNINSLSDAEKKEINFLTGLVAGIIDRRSEVTYSPTYANA